MLKIQYQPIDADVNSANHVDNVRIYDWFNVQRMNYFQSMGLFDGQIRPFLANTTLDFTREVFQQYPVTITTSIEKLGNKSITLKQQVFQQEQLCATCVAISVCFDIAEKQAVPIPEKLRQALELE